MTPSLTITIPLSDVKIKSCVRVQVLLPESQVPTWLQSPPVLSITIGAVNVRLSLFIIAYSVDDISSIVDASSITGRPSPISSGVTKSLSESVTANPVVFNFPPL